MKIAKLSSMGGSGKTTVAAGDDLHSAVLDFLARGRRAPRPKGHP